MCIGMQSGDFSRYFDIDSPIHKLNPLCKIIAFVLFIVMVLLCSSIKAIISLFLILAFVITISNVPFNHYFSFIYSIRFLILFVFLITMFFGFYFSFVFVSKIVLIVMYYCVLMFTTTTNGLVFGFSSFFRPVFGVSAYRISMNIVLFLNFFPCFFDTSRIVKKSCISRGSDRCDFKLVFSSSIRRISNYRKVMDFRDYSGSGDICSYKWVFNDFYMISCHLILFVMILVKEVVV